MTRSIPNYVCVNCGRGFTTKSAAKRHWINVERRTGYIATEAQYRANLITGAIPPPAPMRKIEPRKKKEEIQDIAYRNFHSGFYWRLGELAAENLDPEGRKQQLAMITAITLADM